MSTNSYFVKRAGKLFGPFSFEQVTKSINMGIFSDVDKISTDKMNWQTIQEFCSQDESSEPAEESVPLLQGLKLKIQKTVPLTDSEEIDDVTPTPPVARQHETTFAVPSQTFFSNKRNRMIAGAIAAVLVITVILYFVIAGSSDAKADFMDVYQPSCILRSCRYK